METADKKMEEFLKVAALIDEHLLRGRSMKDMLLTDSMKEPLSPDLVFPMDFIYKKK